MTFDTLVTGHVEVSEGISVLLTEGMQSSDVKPRSGKRHIVPVQYGGDAGEDLEAVAISTVKQYRNRAADTPVVLPRPFPGLPSRFRLPGKATVPDCHAQAGHAAGEGWSGFGRHRGCADGDISVRQPRRLADHWENILACVGSRSGCSGAAPTR